MLINFFAVNISDFNLLCENCTPLKKVTPLSLSNPPPLKVEVLSSHPFLIIWLKVQHPQQKGGYTLWPPLTPPHPTHCTHTKTLLLGSGFHALKFKTLNSEYLNINHFLNKRQNNVVKVSFINKLPQRRIGTEASKHYGSMINFASNIKQVYKN